MSASDQKIFTNEQFRQRKAELDKSAPLKASGPGGTSGDMDQERLARLEGSVEGLRANQTLLMSTIGLVAALLIGLASYTVIQLSALNNRVGELPGKISGDLRDLSGVISQAVTASKQTPPQVILMPAPTPPVAAPPKP